MGISNMVRCNSKTVPGNCNFSPRWLLAIISANSLFVALGWGRLPPLYWRAC